MIVFLLVWCAISTTTSLGLAVIGLLHVLKLQREPAHDLLPGDIVRHKLDESDDWTPFGDPPKKKTT